MINLYEYYFEKFLVNPNSSYDYDYFNEIEKYSKEFAELKKGLIYYDDSKIINDWRNLLYPTNVTEVVDRMLKNSKYYFLSFYLMNEKYKIEEFPTELENTQGLLNFRDTILYNATALNYGRDERGAVKWANRRSIVDSLTVKKTITAISVSKTIEKLIKEISTRGAEFAEMSIDEKLENIRNAYEYLVNMQGGYDKLDYEKLFMGYISESNLIEYSKKLHCFRHGKLDALTERALINESQKLFLINFGIVIINRIDSYNNV